MSTANDNLLIVLQIESERGVQAAGRIAAVEGVDFVFLGEQAR
jgi:2-keto-3-deoxy-L-rhamnonate aldolase RhmA